MSKLNHILTVEPPAWESQNTEYYEISDIKCPTCAGRGWVQTVDEKQARSQMTCPRCGGTGKLKASIEIVYTSTNK
ncbi:MAG: hypothetical protein MdMp024_0050 [Bacteroidales bacterium]